MADANSAKVNEKLAMTPSDLLRQDIPLIDLRSPGEFAQGAFPAAVNLPLLTDGERHEIGTLYKRRGREAAIRHGHELVSGPTRTARIRAWTNFLRNHPNAWLCCWRGGLRSAIVQSWLREAGWAAPRVEGGYKALRRTCIETLDSLAQPAEADAAKRWLMLSGRTGVGKTKVVQSLPQAVDLEGLARHRGSAFGGHEQGQPTPIAFENALAIKYLQHQGRTLIVEDESRNIGRLSLPEAWFAQMRQAAIVLLEAPMEARIEQIRKEYVNAPLAEGLAAAALHERLQASLDRIRKRLGGERHRQVGAALAAGFRDGGHEHWIGLLLAWYYDPMYDYQLQAKQPRVIFTGRRSEVAEFLRAQGTA